MLNFAHNNIVGDYIKGVIMFGKKTKNVSNETNTKSEDMTSGSKSTKSCGGKCKTKNSSNTKSCS